MEWLLGAKKLFSCRQLAELEDKLVRREVDKRVKQLIEERVQEIMNSDSVQQSLHARLVEERKILEDQVRSFLEGIWPCSS